MRGATNKKPQVSELPLHCEPLACAENRVKKQAAVKQDLQPGKRASAPPARDARALIGAFAKRTH